MKLILPALVILVSLLAAPATAQDRDKGFEAYGRDDYAAALIELRPLAEQGDADAQTTLAVMFERGLGVSQDYAEAINWYQLAAEQGHVGAQNNLGVMYGNGRGVPQDHAEAVKWYQLAAEQGIAQTQVNLGVMYENGRGVPQDFARAHMWFNLAAAQGLESAVEHRNNVAKRMTPADISAAQQMAREWRQALTPQELETTSLPESNVPTAVEPSTVVEQLVDDIVEIYEFLEQTFSNAQSWLIVVTALLVLVAFLQWRSLSTQASRLKESVDLSRETAVHELRAYIGVATANIDLTNPKLPTVCVKMRNFGRTPVMNVRSWIHDWLEEHPLRDEDILPPPPDDFQMAASVLQPGSHHIMRTERTHPIHDDVIAHFGTPDATWYIYGEVTYTDVFGEHRSTQYRLIYGGQEPNDGEHLKPDSAGNEMT